MKVLFSLDGHDSVISNIRWSDENGYIISNDKKNNVMLWNMQLVNIFAKQPLMYSERIDKFEATFSSLAVDGLKGLIVGLALKNTVFIIRFIFSLFIV